MDAPRWLEATAARAAEGGRVLHDAQVRSWRETGCALVDGVLPAALVERVCKAAEQGFPAAGSPEAEAITDFGSDGRFAFPAACDALDELTLHPRLLRAVAELLRVEVSELRLTQSDLWAKYGRAGASRDARENDDQRMHVDYPNHTLVHPPPWDAPEAVEMIVYLGDADASGAGATAVVPREGPDDPAYAWPIVHLPGVGELDWVNDRESAERALAALAPESARFRATHLYPRERRVRHRTGTILLYRHDTWHRGTPLAPGQRRFAVNLTFRKAASEWISVLHTGWAWAMYRPGRPMERLIARASVEQRCVLGFPAPGHPYWTPATVTAVEARYGPLGFDATPYRTALVGKALSPTRETPPPARPGSPPAPGTTRSC